MRGTDRIRIEFSDDDLRLRVESFLKSRHFPAFEDLEVSVVDGAVTISGALRSYYEKQVAISSCQRVAGVLALIDRVDVKPRRIIEQRHLCEHRDPQDIYPQPTP